MASFIADKIVMDGLTFDDVLLIPAYSEVLPKTVELKTRFSRNIALNVLSSESACTHMWTSSGRIVSIFSYPTKTFFRQSLPFLPTASTTAA